MAITPGINTWATVDEADTILSQQIGSTDWFSLPVKTEKGGDSQEAFLVTSYRWLSGIYGIGATASAPDQLKLAQILAAQWLISYSADYNDREALIASGVESFDWSQWSEELRSGVNPPRFIVDIMIGLGAGGSNQAIQLYGEDYSEYVE